MSSPVIVKRALALSHQRDAPASLRPGASACVRRWPLALLSLILAGGCSGLRDRHDVPPLALPGQYKNADPAPPAAAESANAPAAPDAEALAELRLAEWWRAFGNAELDGLVNRGLANNPDVRIATLRIVQAKARVDQAEAGLAPNVDAALGAGSQASRSGFGNSGDLPDTGTGKPQRYYQASVKAAWQVDLWGEQRSQVRAAKLRLWQATFDRDNAQRNMGGNVAFTYIEYLGLNDRLRVARELEAILAAQLVAVESRVRSGDATMVELEQQRAALHAARAAIPGLEQQREDALNTIAFLVGAVPGSLALTDRGLDSFSVPTIAPGVPAALLLRRPDLRSAEARLLAADADLDVARARIMPRLDLSAQAGFGSLVFSRLFQAQSMFWGALGSVTASIFDGGRRNSEREYAEAVHEEMVETYARTVHQAVREVEGSLSAIQQTGRRLVAQGEATDAARRAWDISREVYAVGGIDYQTLRETERNYHRNLDDRQRIGMERFQAYASLFHALGGGVRTQGRLPGEGRRPEAVAAAGSGVTAATASAPVQTVQGVDWLGQDAGGDSWLVENFWQVELPGVYDRSTIGATWRDLRARFPQQMANRFIRPRLKGRVDDAAEQDQGQPSWYRLYVAKFDSPAAAEAFCAELRSSYQRCRVVASRPGDGAPETPVAAAPMPPAAAPVTLAGAAKAGSPVAGGAATPLAAADWPPIPLASPVPLAKPAPPPDAAAAATEHLPSPATRAGGYAVQVGAFASYDKAASTYATWLEKGYPAYGWQIDRPAAAPLYAVRIGEFRRRREAAALAAKIARQERGMATVVEARAQPGRRHPLDLNDLLAMNGEPAASPSPAAAVPAAPARAARADRLQRPAFAVQLGAFTSLEHASADSARWRSRGYDVYVCRIAAAGGAELYAVRTGSFVRRQQAAALAASLGRRERVAALAVPAISGAGGEPLPLASPN